MEESNLFGSTRKWKRCEKTTPRAPPRAHLRAALTRGPPGLSRVRSRSGTPRRALPRAPGGRPGRRTSGRAAPRPAAPARAAAAARSRRRRCVWVRPARIHNRGCSSKLMFLACCRSPALRLPLVTAVSRCRRSGVRFWRRPHAACLRSCVLAAAAAAAATPGPCATLDCAGRPRTERARAGRGLVRPADGSVGVLLSRLSAPARSQLSREVFELRATPQPRAYAEGQGCLRRRHEQRNVERATSSRGNGEEIGLRNPRRQSPGLAPSEASVLMKLGARQWAAELGKSRTPRAANRPRSGTIREGVFPRPPPATFSAPAAAPAASPLRARRSPWAAGVRLRPDHTTSGSRARYPQSAFVGWDRSRSRMPASENVSRWDLKTHAVLEMGSIRSPLWVAESRLRPNRCMMHAAVYHTEIVPAMVSSLRHNLWRLSHI